MVTSSLSEVKELTPEFFCNPFFLKNLSGYNFGSSQDGRRVGDVALPPWAGSPEAFIARHRDALESEFVSECLHEWVDLIFGCARHRAHWGMRLSYGV